MQVGRSIGSRQRLSTAAPATPWEERFQSPRPLGVGGMGVVWRAFDLRLQRWVAIKGVRKAGDRGQERLIREARLLARMQHPSLVQVYDLICEPDIAESESRVWWLVMEFVEGETLTRRVRTGAPLEIEEVTELGVSLAGGLAEAHAYGLVHRDLSSGNVILPARGPAKLLDFGLATPVKGEPSTAEGSDRSRTVAPVIGTPGFIAPERLEGVAADRRSDLYGLGAVLFFALTGQKLQKGDVSVEKGFARFRRIGAGRIETPPDILTLRPDCPPPLAECIDRLLSRDPSGRGQSAETVVHDLGALERQNRPPRRTEAAPVANGLRWSVVGVVRAAALVTLGWAAAWVWFHAAM